MKTALIDLPYGIVRTTELFIFLKYTQ
jgi:hypothetical protein